MALNVLYYSQGREEDKNALTFINSLLSEKVDEIDIIYVTEKSSEVEEKRRLDLAREQREHFTSVESEEALEDAKNVFSETTINVITTSSTGDPVEEVIYKLEEQKFDLFALSAFGRGGFSKEILGAHVKPILERSNLPVLIHKGELASCERVLMHVPNDKERCINLANYMSRFLKHSKPSVTFLSILEEGHPRFDGYTSPEDEEGLAEVRKDYEFEEKAYLQRAKEILTEEGIEAEIRHRIGGLTDELLKEAREGRYDLMSFAPEKPGLLQSLWEGNVSFEIIRDVEISVLKFLKV
ncbi:MAG: universal stress protein [Candidatus Bipolaricaulota bacterium]|nr:universal stress protein [Candidatus Bipolaricaulota bacterium]